MPEVVLKQVFFLALRAVFAPQIAPLVVFVLEVAVVQNLVLHPLGFALVAAGRRDLTQQVEARVIEMRMDGFIPVLGLARVGGVGEESVACGVESVVLCGERWLACLDQATGLVVVVQVRSGGRFHLDELARKVVAIGAVQGRVFFFFADQGAVCIDLRQARQPVVAAAGLEGAELPLHFAV